MGISTLRLRTVMTIPVLMGDNLPRKNGDDVHDDKFYRYMLLLFRPWRSYGELRHTGEMWAATFE
jgi:hypothetical protein